MNEDDDKLIALIVGALVGVSLVGAAVAWIVQGTQKVAAWMIAHNLLVPPGQGVLPVTDYASLDLPRIVVVVGVLVALGVLGSLFTRRRS